MTQDDALAAVARDLNTAPGAAARAERYRALVEDTNRRVREAADALLGPDGSPSSFEAYKAACSPEREAP